MDDYGTVSMEIIDSDKFLDMPSSAQALYFHLAIRADNKGFVNNPKSIQRAVRASDSDFKILVAKHYISLSSDGITIEQWETNNDI